MRDTGAAEGVEAVPDAVADAGADEAGDADVVAEALAADVAVGDEPPQAATSVAVSATARTGRRARWLTERTGGKTSMSDGRLTGRRPAGAR